MNVSSNHSYSSQQISQENALAISIIFQFDAVIRISSFLIHSFYFFLVFKFKIMRTKACFYTHHANFIGFLFNLHYIFYWSDIHPDLRNELFNNLICSMSEEFWAILKTLRTYSIALIAFYRLIAVFKVKLYNRINKSKISIMVPVFFMYMWVALITVSNKLIFNTTYGYLYCFDGYSSIFLNSFGYFLVQTFAGIILPTMFGVVAYLIVIKRLKLKFGVPRSSKFISQTRNPES
jgi:hypothetical protein